VPCELETGAVGEGGIEEDEIGPELIDRPLGAVPVGRLPRGEPFAAKRRGQRIPSPVLRIDKEHADHSSQVSGVP